MNDASAGETTPVSAEPAVDEDRLFLLYVIYGDRLMRHLRARLGAQWELAEDLAQDTWEIVTRKLNTCRASDDQAFGWIAACARTAISTHFRKARTQREVSTDFSAPLAEGLLPPAFSAEDHAIANVVAEALVADSPAPLGVAA